ncbi:MAG: PBP1A family penicillin-binding protein [Acidobacteriota bacterium]|nr:PBP1A family penicillin-binding protein [Acidobacteriota bacterium]
MDQKLQSGPFGSASNFYASPRTLTPGEEISTPEIAAALRRAGYSDRPDDSFGWYRIGSETVEVHPGNNAVVEKEPAAIHIASGRISSIWLANARQNASQYQLEPELLTNFTDGSRARRRMVRYDEIPKVLVNALISAEDKRFFDHSGLDMRRMLKAAYVDFKDRRKEQGASTITMQLARGIWLEPQKAWKRKLTEILITMQLERKLSKQQILEHYCNLIYLGRRDTFSIHGFGEAAQTFFSKDIGELTLPEAATLAGMVQRPTYFNPFKYPARAVARRNVILTMMRQNGYITESQFQSASAAPLKLAPRLLDTSGAPYFLALVNDELQERLGDDAKDGEAYQVFTTLDWDLQRAAQKAVEMGMEGVDKLIKGKRKKNDPDTTLPQVALIALDPHTGYIKAVVGGRNYARSQLNHALSLRQPGSVFKPFVYAAALNTAVEGGKKIITAANTLEDEPTTFKFGNQIYEPGNYKQNYHGTVTLRRALASSMNIATVHLAEQVGYAKVVQLARKCGLNEDIQATPAVALGAYEATPMEMAGAYTVFANGGMYLEPTFLASVRSRDGKLAAAGSPERHQALDPRVNYLMVNLLEEVMRSGTGAGVRSKGFKAPAAGKTGTSRDGWFAGFTSGLLCVVWVGFDDNRELDLEGARSALPIWAEFMRRAVALGVAAKPFEKVKGVVGVNIDPDTGQLASELCGPGRVEYFIAGTQPASACEFKALPLDGVEPADWQRPAMYQPN